MWKIKVKQIKEEGVEFVKMICNLTSCEVDEVLWESKYDNNIIYCYKPRLVENYNLIIIVQAKDENSLKFFKYTFNYYVKLIQHIINCYNLTTDENI